MNSDSTAFFLIPAAFALCLSGIALTLKAQSPAAEPERREAGESREASGDRPEAADPARGSDSEAGGADRLSSAECERLYTHQLQIIRSDPDNPLYSSVQLNEQVLQNPATRAAEVRHCRERISRKNFDCQMAADDLAGLLLCRRQFDGRSEEDPNKPEQKKTSPGDANQEAYFEDLSTDNPAGENSGRPETMPSGRFVVNAANCERAYNHIYSVISKTENFRQRPDRARLESYWQSGEARESFAARCQAQYKPEDLGCLLSTRDADVLQGCLLVIPAG